MTDTFEADHLLMQKIAQKDAAAYRLLVGRYLNFCVRFGERMLGNRQDAEDVTQEVCLTIWSVAETWQPKAKFSTWLYRVMYNRCIDFKRKVVPFAPVDMTQLEDKLPQADEQMDNDQQAALVRKALRRLPERQRAALVLSYYEDIGNREAADAMGIHVNAFQQLLYRARQALKQELITDRMERSNDA